MILKKIIAILCVLAGLVIAFLPFVYVAVENNLPLNKFFAQNPAAGLLFISICLIGGMTVAVYSLSRVFSGNKSSLL